MTLFFIIFGSLFIGVASTLFVLWVTGCVEFPSGWNPGADRSDGVMIKKGVSVMLLIAFLAFLLLVAVKGHAQPMPLPAAPVEAAGPPQTFPCRVLWNANANIVSYSLTVNGSLFLTTNNTVTNVPFLLGTNALRLTAINALGAATVTNIYTLNLNSDVTVTRYWSATPLGNKIILSSEVIINPASDRYYGHTVTLTNRLEGVMQ